MSNIVEQRKPDGSYHRWNLEHSLNVLRAKRQLSGETHTEHPNIDEHPLLGGRIR